MLSMPPATITELVPARSRSCASMAAFMPEPHILFTVVQPTASGRPAPMLAWRAGACPWPAARTLPMITSSMSSGAMPARSTAARIAAAPSCGAEAPASSPRNAPIGVRAADTIAISFDISWALVDRRQRKSTRCLRRSALRGERLLW